jgi:hypothetical protein
MDNDGRDDLIVLHGGWHALGYYPQTEQGLSREVKYLLPTATRYNYQGVSVGDVNGDGCKDVAIADYNNGLVLLHGKNCRKPAPRVLTDLNR